MGACAKWCSQAETDSDAKEACDACDGGPQTNPTCKDADCSYCDKEITFPRHYPKLWREEPSFHGKMAKLEGATRCWCQTGCPVYKVKSFLWCHKPCAEICATKGMSLHSEALAGL